MNTLIMWVMACGAVLGGLDRILGNRFGLGKRFEEGFELLGDVSKRQPSTASCPSMWMTPQKKRRTTFF